MGTEETGWVDVANNLLSKCNVSLRVRDLTDCGAHVFTALYEAILGEKVPDYLPAPRSQEREAHNVQAIIDSLALDYLQVSLSHITGENVVRGDTESIQNLLEIFDGLLEYLSEQISEVSSQNGDFEKYKSSHSVRQQEESLQRQNGLAPPPRSPPSPPSPGSSDIFAPSWDVDGSESTTELIRLGDTAHTFTARSSDLERLRLVQGGDGQPLGPRSPPRRAEADSSLSAPLGDVMGITKQDQLMRPKHINQDIQVCRPYLSKEMASSHAVPAALTETSKGNAGTGWPRVPSPQHVPLKSAGKTSPSTHKKVAFRTLPDVRFVAESAQDSSTFTTGAEEDTGADTTLTERHSLQGSESSLRDHVPGSITEEPLSVQQVRSNLSEQELKEMSEKLSRRLDELDRMLKKVLEERSREEDKLSQHSDSIMEIGRKQQLHVAGTQHVKSPPSRARSVSSSPIPAVPLHVQFEDALHRDARGETGRIRRELQQELDQQRVKSQVLSRAYEDELQDFEEREMAKLSNLKAKLKKTEQEFKENICKEHPKMSRPQRVYSGKRVPQPAKPDQPVAQPAKPGPQSPTRNRPPVHMRVRDNDLLPLVLEEFPHLHISPHTLNNMWRSQSAQIEHLSNAAQEEERSERKLQREVEEARKKYEVLVGLIRKEQGHNQRLKDFKERIRLQKSTQNKMRENRQQVARAKRYHDDYHVQLRAKLMRARTREERIVKKLFADGLELQKRRLREMRSYAKEQREVQRKRHKDELDSMENYYKDQFSMLADAVTQERHQIQAQEKAQAKTLQRMKRELRARMEEEIRGLQEMIIKADDDAFFRELEAERLKQRLQMASFQYSQSHCL